MARRDELIAELTAREIPVPTEGTGKNGSVLVEDLEAALGMTPDETVQLNRGGFPKYQRTLKGNRRINH